MGKGKDKPKREAKKAPKSPQAALMVARVETPIYGQKDPHGTSWAMQQAANYARLQGKGSRPE